ncbi:1-acyl-sn-glycerol-3-phosphate acyltransferase [Candidatus Poribacteria bacterium]|nr:1-acyl-sn-glycerol-3-phosphate acyltransferase [Candidatus Poribacteria bacterium]
MIDKSTVNTGTDSPVLEFKSRDIGSVLLIFLANLVGFWFLLPACLLMFGSLLDRAFSLPVFPLGPILLWSPVAAAMALSGLLLGLCSILIFAYYGDGFPIASMPPRRLVDKGPYSRSRHPIYLGYTISLAGVGILFRSASFLLFVVPAFSLCWLMYAILHEERVLLRRYGQRYANYRDSTPLLFWLSSFRGRHGNRLPPLTYMLTSVLFRVINRLFFEVEVLGDPNPATERPFVVVANHANYLDPFIISAYLKDFVRISTTEKAYRSSVARLYLKAVGAYPLARYKLPELRSVRESLRILKANESLALFPEGERTWDGESLDIDDAVIRFLEAAGQPILAVNISGSYNMFPRWAGLPRRGKLWLQFHPVFYLAHDKTVEENRRLLLEKLHRPGRSYDDALWMNGDSLAEGLPLLLWRCPLCKTNDALIAEKENGLHCASCAARWELKGNYHLKLLTYWDGLDGRSPTLLSEWYALVRDLKDPAPIGVDYHFLSDGETVFLESKRVSYSQYQGLRKNFCHKGRLVLTGKRLVFFNDKALYEDGLSEIRKIVIEGNNRLEIGLDGRMISVRFHDESPLKWQTYIDRIRAIVNS